MSDDGENVTRLPVRFKEQQDPEKTLRLVQSTGQCLHLFVTYVVAEAEAEVECGACGEKLNPMWVLRRLCGEERRMAEARERYQEEMKRLSERSRTKCEHCQRMTRISRR